MEQHTSHTWFFGSVCARVTLDDAQESLLEVLGGSYRMLEIEHR